VICNRWCVHNRLFNAYFEVKFKKTHDTSQCCKKFKGYLMNFSLEHSIVKREISEKRINVFGIFLLQALVELACNTMSSGRGPNRASPRRKHMASNRTNNFHNNFYIPSNKFFKLPRFKRSKFRIKRLERRNTQHGTGRSAQVPNAKA
jgi:hypothetical protein